MNLRTRRKKFNDGGNCHSTSTSMDQGGENSGLTIITNTLYKVIMSNNARSNNEGGMASLNREVTAMRAAVTARQGTVTGRTKP